MSRKSRFLTVLVSVLTAAILIAALLAQVKLTRASDENAKLEEKLSELCSENARLEIEYEKSVSLPELEEYAKTTLGMERAQNSAQIKTEAEARDKAEILSPSDKLVSSIIEYSGETRILRSCHEKVK